MNNTEVIMLTGVLAAAACALPGVFLVLRGMSLLGDAISHAVLPGIAVAVLVTQSLDSWVVLIGAGATGLLTVYLIDWLRRTRRVREDASIAIVFPALFALGVLIVSRYATHTDLDQDCVLYGEIALAPLDTIVVGGVELFRPILVLGIVALLNLGLVLVLYKELKLSTFDAAYAATIGLSPVLVHYLLMASVSVTTVASFEVVGAIIVVAFLIVPPAAAFLLCEKLSRMILTAVGIGALSAVLGTEFAVRHNASIAGCMAAAMGACFLLAWTFSPRSGLLTRAVRARRIRERYQAALVLERLAQRPTPTNALAQELRWTPERVRGVLASLSERGFVEERAELPRVTPAGLAFARSVVD